MSGILGWIILAFYIVLGGVPSLAMIIGLPYVIGTKIYRKIRYGIKLTD